MPYTGIVNLSDYVRVGVDYDGSPLIIVPVAELARRLGLVLPDYRVSPDIGGDDIRIKLERQESNEQPG